jgi:NADPH:quinone reductase-like Zn-dependent oxidoreductase
MLNYTNWLVLSRKFCTRIIFLGRVTRRFYMRNPFGRLVRDVDIVFDTVGGETLKRSWSLLKPRGRMVTLPLKSEGTKDERIEKAFFIVEPNQKLTEISRLLDSRPTPTERSRRDAAKL